MKKAMGIILFGFLLSGCGYVVSDDDIVYERGEITNLETFQQFLENVEKNEEGNIRIVTYTDEGDPVIQDIDYDGEKYTSTTDTKRDKFSSGGVSTAICNSLDVEEIKDRTIYKLTECKPANKEPVLLITP